MREHFRNPHPDIGKIGYLTIAYEDLLSDDTVLVRQEAEPATLLSVHQCITTLKLKAVVRNERTGEQLTFENAVIAVASKEYLFSCWPCVSSKRSFTEASYLKWRRFKME